MDFLPLAVWAVGFPMAYVDAMRMIVDEEGLPDGLGFFYLGAALWTLGFILFWHLGHVSLTH